MLLYFLGMVWQDSPLIFVPLGTLSLCCTGIYTASWQFDPCCKYQVIYLIFTQESCFYLYQNFNNLLELKHIFLYAY